MPTVKVNISAFASAMGFCQQRIINELHLGMRQAVREDAGGQSFAHADAE